MPKIKLNNGNFFPVWSKGSEIQRVHLKSIKQPKPLETLDQMPRSIT